MNQNNSSAEPIKTIHPYAWIVWLCSVLFYFYEFSLQSSPSVMTSELMRAFQVNAGQLGTLSAYYFYAYALMQLPVGLLLDSLGPRLIMTIACFLCALGSFIFSHTHSLHGAELARFLMGIGSSCAFINALKLASLWFPSNRFAVLAGLILAVGMLGAIGGQVPLSHFINHYGWRSSMEILSYSGFGLAILFYLLVRNGANFEKMRNDPNHQKSFSTDGLKIVLLSPQMWLMSLFGALMFAPTPAFGELWGIPFIVATFGVDTGTASKIISGLFIGWMIGSPLFGYLTDRYGNPLHYLKLGTFLAFVSILILLFLAQHSVILFTIILFLFGVFSSAFLLVFTIAKESMELEYAGTVSGFLNMINELVPGLLQAGMGLVLNWCWNGKILNGAHCYSAMDYHKAAFTLPLVVGTALLLVFLIRPGQKK